MKNTNYTQNFRNIKYLSDRIKELLNRKDAEIKIDFKQIERPTNEKNNKK